VDALFARTYDELERLLTTVGDFCARYGVAEAVVFALQLTAEELFTNLVRHNQGGSDHILFDLERTTDGIVMRLTDHDVDAFDITQAPAVDVTAPLSQRQAGGLGVHLVKTYMDDLVCEYNDRTMRITATKRLEA
jgi:serine/threonine-protein kinase RsbW